MREKLKALSAYLPGISLPRLANIGLYAGSSLLSRLSGRPVVLNRPFILMVEPTSFCNLRCPLCPTGEGTLGLPARSLGFLARGQRFLPPFF